MGEADKERARAKKRAEKAAAAEAAAAGSEDVPQKRPGGMAWRRGTGRAASSPTKRGNYEQEPCRRKGVHPPHVHSMNGEKYTCPGK